MTEFAHLHLHTDSSLLDGVGRIEEYVKQAQISGIHHLAITDHGVMYGAIRWFNKLTEAGLHPIIGMEAYLAEGSAKARSRDSYHLLILAENDTGYRNLMKLATYASLEGFYYKPRIDLDVLQAHREGLIVTSACISGPLARNIVSGKHEIARTYAERLNEIVGQGNFFVELQDHGLPLQHEANRGLIDIARSLNLPLVATNDVHYCQPEDSRIQDIMLCVQTGKTLATQDRMRAETDQLYFKSGDEMSRLFAEMPESISNTISIAERCNVDLSFKQYLLPDFAVPDGFTTDTYLEHLCRQGVERRYGHCEREVSARLEYELGVIKGMGFSGYFLVVWDFVKFAKDSGILVGPGRGSAAGSIVTYALGITALDPLEHSLLFERFLNPDRISMPDIDIDFADDRRQEVIDYIVRKYGSDRVAQIATLGTLGARASIRNVGRVMDIPLTDIDRVTKLIPTLAAQGEKVELKSSLEKVKELRDIYETDETIRELLDAAMRVEGKARNASTHAAGVVIARGPLVDHVPLQRGAGKGEGEVTTQYEMNDLQETGLLKIDVLGLTTLTTLGKAVELARRKNPSLTLDSIPLEDADAYAMLRRGDTAGVFQLEGGPTSRTTIDVSPERFADLTALMALIRPGPGALVPQYRDRKSGKEKIDYLHPDLEAILKETYGVAIYQEQIMQLTNVLAGFSMGEGDQIRKAMGKKDFRAMANLEERFISGSVERDLSENDAKAAWEIIRSFAGYGFNKAHSAAYAVIAAQCAYLKAHYPAEFMAALLATDSGKTQRLAVDIVACKRRGITVLAPDVNVSDVEFAVESRPDESEAIRFGLRAVKGVGDGAARAIVEAREQLPEGTFGSLSHFAESVDWSLLNKRAVEALARAGAMDPFGSRDAVIASLSEAIETGQRRQKSAARGQMDFFASGEIAVVSEESVQLRSGTALDQKQILAWEREYLGTYLSAHPIEPYLTTENLSGAVQIAELSDAETGDPIKVIVLVSGIRTRMTKANRKMAVLDVEDLTASIEVVVYPNSYAGFEGEILVDTVVELNGSVDRRGDRLQLIMNTCRPLAEPIIHEPRLEIQQTLNLSLPIESTVSQQVELLQKLDRLFAEFEGDIALVFHVPTQTRGIVQMRSRTRLIEWNQELEQALNEMLPAHSIRLDSAQVLI